VSVYVENACSCRMTAGGCKMVGSFQGMNVWISNSFGRGEIVIQNSAK